MTSDGPALRLPHGPVLREGDPCDLCESPVELVEEPPCDLSCGDPGGLWLVCSNPRCKRQGRAVRGP